ncbi:GNAT family N-acetyltransferase [Mycolicibacterium sp. 018/SC-01/001]|uniref:GNAT family N-acetyltransferase n=1 Tax=Mycolicibacterium sp. 018/SC-01/001 TaxID=2592069 RepID=UPI00117DF35A|nr:GNAT family N-acetyltransferase [Mycolicibacterium sp. 018/SC-01/001]TRW84826.1 GNAT family N-acetyltransferase [Mycolicibacterium sp. 018/SC-01/001]
MERHLSLQVTPADPARIDELADVAAHTFPLACPPSCTADDVAAFIAENLTRDRFADYLRDPDRTVLTATDGDRIVGYAMLIGGAPGDPDVAAAVTARPTVELSKMYVLPEAHGAGASAALMSAALQHASAVAAASVWLGVNQKNVRAQRFYRKHGFEVTGTKSFLVGEHLEQDYVMVRPV